MFRGSGFRVSGGRGLPVGVESSRFGVYGLSPSRRIQTSARAFSKDGFGNLECGVIGVLLSLRVRGPRKNTTNPRTAFKVLNKLSKQQAFQARKSARKKKNTPCSRD